MTPKRICRYISILATLFTIQASAQETTVKYYDRYGSITSSKQAINTYKIFTPSDNPALVKVKEINIYTKAYSTGTVNKSDSLDNGTFQYYNPDNKLVKTQNYVNGRKEGTCTEYSEGVKVAEYMFTEGFIQQAVTEYYPSGKVKAQKQYLKGTDQILAAVQQDTAISNYLLKNSTGDVLSTEVRLRNIDGLWDGACTYYYESGKMASEEQFKAGKLEKAVFYDSLGRQVKTEKNVWNLEKMPAYRGDYISFISNNLLYPKRALETETSGTVVVGFWVSATGTVSDMKVLKSVSPEMDAEALRVLKKTERKWTPALYHNIPVAQYYLAPIIYTLQSNNQYMLR